MTDQFQPTKQVFAEWLDLMKEIAPAASVKGGAAWAAWMALNGELTGAALAALTSKADAINIPAGSVWEHTNGKRYTVIGMANVGGGKAYEPHVVYQGENGKLWTRPASDWARSMKPKGIKV